MIETNDRAAIGLHIGFSEVPTKTMPDWSGLAAMVKAHGPVLVAPDVDALTAHACMHKHGVGIYKVVIGGQLVGYTVEPKRNAKKVTA